MKRAWAERLSRILIAGDGTLLVADQALTEPRGISEVLVADHPLRQAAEQIRTVRLYAWLPDPTPGTAPIGISVDVTELIGVSEDAGRFLDALLSVGPDSVLVLDVPRGELLWSNRRLAGQLGYPGDQL